MLVMLGKQQIMGLTLTVSPHATKRVTNWPEVRRSKRLYKKLLKKRGPQFSDQPCMLKTPFGIFVHPHIYAELIAATERGA